MPRGCSGQRPVLLRLRQSRGLHGCVILAAANSSSPSYRGEPRALLVAGDVVPGWFGRGDRVPGGPAIPDVWYVVPQRDTSAIRASLRMLAGCVCDDNTTHCPSCAMLRRSLHRDARVCATEGGAEGGSVPWYTRPCGPNSVEVNSVQELVDVLVWGAPHPGVGPGGGRPPPVPPPPAAPLGHPALGMRHEGAAPSFTSRTRCPRPLHPGHGLFGDCGRVCAVVWRVPRAVPQDAQAAAKLPGRQAGQGQL